MIKVLAALAVAISLGIFASSAEAAYNITQGTAQRYTLEAADTRYGESFGVTAEGAWCYPQGRFQDRRYIPGRYHRWTCVWSGYDFEDAGVYGSFIIAGNTGAGRFSYMQIRGGLRWA